jgi:glyoxylase-like metal-dependent hydrolase (beta-lactamase superfamily II)
MLRDGIDVARTRLVIFTHGHPDHLESTERFDDSVIRAISTKEYAYMQDEGSELFLATAARMPMKPFKLLLNEGTLSIGKETFQVILTPGHSPGSICLYNPRQKVLISGDTLFYLGVGRTDLPGGDINRLAESIGKLAKLDIDLLIPGHGDMLKGRQAIKKNFEIITAEFFGSY